MTTRSTAIVLLVLSTAAGAAPRIEPPNPVEFERIALRQDVDSCVFDDDAVQVRLEGRTFVVEQRSNQCLVPGPPEVVDIQLGAVPAGDYRVEVREGTQPVAQLDFTVSGIYRAAVFPPPPHPLANYTGLWWGGEPGWGLSLQQGATGSLFGTLLVLDASGAPRWYTLQSGPWQSSTRWSGRVLRSGSANGQVTHVDVGSAVFEFAMAPGREGVAQLTLVIDGVTTTRSITRLRL